MSDLLATLVLGEGTINVLLGSVIALQAWVVRRQSAHTERLARVEEKLSWLLRGNKQ